MGPAARHTAELTASGSLRKAERAGGGRLDSARLGREFNGCVLGGLYTGVQLFLSLACVVLPVYTGLRCLRRRLGGGTYLSCDS